MILASARQTGVRRSAANSTFAGSLRPATVILALLVRAGLAMGVFSDLQGLALNTLLLLVYLVLEVRLLWTRDAKLFWINPAVLGSALTFAMGFGVTNVLYFMPEETLASVGLRPVATIWMNQLMLLVILGACAMWVGYSSAAGRSLGRFLRENRVLNRSLRVSGEVNVFVILIALGISLLAHLLAIKLGVFGYAASYDQLIAGANYSQFLMLAQSLGNLALLGAAIHCFSTPRSSIAARLLLCFVLAIRLAVGFLTAFKTAVIMPFIITGIIYYTQRGRFPRWMVPAVIVALMAGYAVIEPFRIIRSDDPDFVGTSVGNIAGAMASGVGSQTGGGGDERPSTILSILARSNYTYIASLGIEFAATNPLPEDSPSFLGDIFLAPAHALIPRFIWQSKPLRDIGLWYTYEVMGRTFYNSTGMSPFTYLNFAGGPLAVIFGFLLVGVMQRGLFDGLRDFGHGGLVVYLGLVGTLVNVNSAFNSFILELVRYLPVMIVAQWFLINRAPRDRA